MKKTIYTLGLFSLFSLFLSSAVLGQNLNPVYGQTVAPKVIDWQLSEIQSALSSAPLAGAAQGKLLSLATPDGQNISVEVFDAPMLSSEMALQFPTVKTYRVFGVNDKSISGRIMTSAIGFHGTIFTSKGQILYERVGTNNNQYSVKYAKKGEFQCNTDNHPAIDKGNLRTYSNGSTLRRYDFAAVMTPEFVTGNGGTSASAGLIVTQHINSLNAVYEKEVAITFTLLTPYANPTTISFQDLPAVNTILNTQFTAAAYDIGHCFHHESSAGSGSGLASVGVVCGSSKGRGWSGANPSNGSLFMDILYHEVAHQFNATHTFNGSGSSCQSAISATSSYEIGSGSTIMGYPGVCGTGQNSTQNGDIYFHTHSLQQMTTFATPLTCDVETATGNTAPVVNANPSSASYVIPKSTPFELTGSGTDANGDPIIYTWEQYDEDGGGVATQGFIGATAGASAIAPLFRSYPGTTSPTRVFPALNYILSNTAYDFEPLPSVARTLNFRLTGRDNKAGGGGIHCSGIAVTVNGTAGPFAITSQNTATSWTANGTATQTVTWNVNGTDAAPINCANVTILFSTDGGQTFPYTLVASTPNNGTATFVVPSYPTTVGRVKVKCASGNIFFDINNANITIASSCAAEAATVAPTAAVSAPAGNALLNLGLTPVYGTLIPSFSGTVATTDPSSNTTGSSSGSCSSFNTTNYDTYSFVVSTTGIYTFNKTAGASGIVLNLYAGAYDPNNTCTNWLVSSATSAGAAYSLGNSISYTLNPGIQYTLVVSGFGAGTPALPAAYTVTVAPPAGAGAYTTTPNPGATFTYGYVVVNTVTNSVTAIQATSNLTNAATFPAGTYSVYGLSYSNATTLASLQATYVGQPFATLQSAMALLTFCGDLSTNLVSVTVTGPTCTAPTIGTQPAPTQTVCSGQSVSFTVASVTGGTIPYTYQWKKGATNVTNGGTISGATTATLTISAAAVADAGTYTVVVTENAGCTATSSNSVLVVNATPTASVAPSATTLCTGQTLTLTASPAGATYNWAGPVAVSSATAQAPTVTNITAAGAGTYTVTVTQSGCTATANSGAITVNTTPTVTAGSNSPICAGAALNLTSTPAAATSYNWAGPNSFTSAIQNPNIAAATTAATGTYNVTVTANGCTATGSTAATVNALPSATITSNSPVCTNGTISLSVPAGATSYSWTGPSVYTNGTATVSIASATAANAGAYNVTVTGAGSCTATSTTNVTVSGAIAATSGSNTPVCTGTTLNLTASGGTTYNWTGPNSFASSTQNPTISSVTALAAGTYTVTVSNGTCSVVTTTVVAVNTTPTPTAGSNTPVCTGGNINLTSSGGGTYSWSGPNVFSNATQNPTISAATTAMAGTYIVTVTSSGCTATASTSVVVNTTPGAIVATGGTVCAGNTLNLTATSTGATTYSWTGPNSFTSAVQNPSIPTATVAATGTYNVTASANGCSVTGSTSATVNPNPTATAGSNAPFCSGGNLNLTSSGGASYSWSGPASFASATQNPAVTSATVANNGTYTVTVTAAVTGCTATASTGVTINANPTATAGGPGTVCTGGAINLTSSGGTSYAWSGPSTYTSSTQNPSVTASAVSANGGSYVVTVTNASSCTATASTTVIVAASLTASAGSNSPVCTGATLNLNATGGSTYSWTGPNSFTSSSQTPSISGATAAAAGTYNVTVTSGTCTATASTVVVVNTTPSPIASSNSPVCTGATLNLSTTPSGATYNWTGPVAVSSASAQAPTVASVTAAAAGTYTVTVTVSGCTATASTTVVVNTTPTTTATSGTVCTGSTLNLTATGGGTYSWAGPSGFSSTSATPSITNITAAAAGAYTVTVTTSGCTATATTTPTINTTPTASAGSNSPVCVGSALNLTSGGGATYAWTGPNTFTSATQNPTIAAATLAASGTYNVTVTAANACTATASTSATVNAIPSAPSATTAVSICQGGTATPLSATGTGLKWYSAVPPAGLIGATAPTPSTAATGMTNYYVTQTVNGCESPATTIVVTITPAAACFVPIITNNPASILPALPANPAIKDPCTCSATANYFDESVVVEAPSGEVWSVVATTMLQTGALSPIPTATVLTEVVLGGGLSAYYITGRHQSGTGYTMTVSSPSHPGSTLTQSNTCYAPTASLVGLAATYTIGTAAFALAPYGVAANSATGTKAFTVNGTAATMLDPAAIGVGNTASIAFTFTGTGNGSSPATAKCASTVSQSVQIVPNPTSMLCKNHVELSLPALGCNYSVIGRANDFLIGTYNAAAYTVDILQGQVSVVSPAPASAIGVAQIGQSLTYTVTETATGNKCWGTLAIEDKTAPQFACPGDVTVMCSNDIQETTTEKIVNTEYVFLAPGNNPYGTVVAAPTVMDCSNYTLYYSDVVTDFPCPSPYPSVAGNYTTKTVIRTYRAKDIYGNEKICSQTITFQRPVWVTAPTLTISNPKSFDCNETFAKDASGNPAPSASGTLNITIGGITVPAGLICDLMSTYTDVIVPTCGNGYKVIRTWLVADWCKQTNNTATFEQIIKVEDKTRPIITCNTSDLKLSTSPNACTLNNFTVPLPQATDNCDNNLDWTIKLLKEGTNQILQTGLVMNNIPVGTYDLRYAVVDDCGNINDGVCQRKLIVEDKVSPVAVCDKNTKISLTIDGTATVEAATFNDGSSDNCLLASSPFKVSRDGGSLGANVKFTCADKKVMITLEVTDFYDNKNTCMVEATIEDKIDPVIFVKDFNVICSNNADAKAYLDVNKPQLKAINDYPTAANPGYFDACTPKVTFTDDAKIDNCGTGTYKRTWTVTDASGRTATAVQTLTSATASAYRVRFPDDVLNLTCTPNKVYNTKPSTTGQPIITPLGNPGTQLLTCPNVGVEYSDETFDAVPGACFKILRKWKVFSMCQLANNPSVQELETKKGTGQLYVPKNPTVAGLCGAPVPRTFTNIEVSLVSGAGLPATTLLQKTFEPLVKDNNCYAFDTDGYMEFTQVILVNDAVPPVFTVVPDPIFTDASATCAVKVTLKVPTATDCTDKTDFTYQLIRKSDNSIFAFGSITDKIDTTISKANFGDYIVRYKVTDRCGNYASTDKAITVKDKKKPTPVCYQGFSTALMPTTGMVTINATTFDAGSYDNCTTHNNLKFFAELPDSLDQSTTLPSSISVTFKCKGLKLVRLWTQDEAGNADYCDTYVDVQYPWEGAPGAAVVDSCVKIIPIEQANIAGIIATENDKKLSNAKVNVSGSNVPAGLLYKMTSLAGAFNFALPQTGNYEVVPELDKDPLNGVSTFDLVLMNKHILGNQLLGSPYKMIAADINQSKTITTFDMVELRKLILHIYDKLPNNTSWRFVDKDYKFPVPTSPWKEKFPEKISIDKATLDADFIAVKVGDLNGNVVTTANEKATTRGTGTLTMEVENQILTTNEVANVSFHAKDLANIEGYQMTLEYDPKLLRLSNIEGNDENFAVLEEGVITMSWNGALENEATLFGLNFIAKNNNVSLAEAIKVTSRLTTAEAYTRDGQRFEIGLKFKNAAPHLFELFQNKPNPSNGKTTIGFNLPQASTATLTIMDATGKTLRVMEGDYKAGYNEITIESLSVSGVLQYRLDTPTNSATKKMVVTE